MARTRHASGPARRAITIGKTLAARVLKVRDQGLARRAAAVRRAGGRPVAVRAAPPRLASAAGAPARGVLVAEGDSWFDYPWHDVLSALEDDHGFDVTSVAHAGDPVEAMAYAGAQLTEFTSTIERLLRSGAVPAAILLSGGGNDIAGDEFAMLLNHAASPRPGLSDPVLRGVIDERMRDAYIAILSAVTVICRVRTGYTIPIIVHGYDYPVPDGRGVLGGWGLLPGPWLRPSLHAKGFGDLAQNTRMLAQVIDRFNAMIAAVAAMSDFAHVRYLNLRGTLSNGAGYRTWWANELHPTLKGFRAIADRFAALI